MIYVDGSALVKLVRSEAESDALAAWLEPRRDLPLVSSALVEVEVVRALRRTAPQALVGVDSVLRRLARSEITSAVRARATAYPDAMLRSLDAVHLATAEILRDRPGVQFEAFVTYDVRLAQAAAALGLPTVSPGS